MCASNASSPERLALHFKRARGKNFQMPRRPLSDAHTARRVARLPEASNHPSTVSGLVNCWLINQREKLLFGLRPARSLRAKKARFIRTQKLKSLHKSCNSHNQRNYINLIYVAIERETSFSELFPPRRARSVRVRSGARGKSRDLNLSHVII